MAECRKRSFPRGLACALFAAIVTTSRSEPNVLIKSCPVGRDTFKRVQGLKSKVQGQRREAMGVGVRSGHFREQGPGPGWSAKRDGTRCFTEKSRAKLPLTRLD